MKDEPTPNLEKQLEQYINGNLPTCNHPIKAVDDNYFCHKCGKQLQPIKHVSEADQLRARIVTLEAENARLTAANESMQEDAVQNTYAFNLMLTANKKQATQIEAQGTEIRRLRNVIISYQAGNQ